MTHIYMNGIDKKTPVKSWARTYDVLHDADQSGVIALYYRVKSLHKQSGYTKMILTLKRGFKKIYP